jgi:phosphatidylglycerophosphate synthase
LIAALLYLPGSPLWTAIAGLTVTLKDLLDSADGQLARAKKQYSRIGRFLDSIGDFVVNLAVFAAIGYTLVTSTGNPMLALLSALAFAGISLRVSYHVFYQTSFLHIRNSYATNRTSEEILPADLEGDHRALLLQRIFLLLYGWQDAFVQTLDRRAGREMLSKETDVRRWYSDPTALLLSGLIGIGTELFLLMIFSVGNALELYLVWNCLAMNALWGGCIAYRRWVLLGKIRGKGQEGGG